MPEPAAPAPRRRRPAAILLRVASGIAAPVLGLALTFAAVLVVLSVSEARISLPPGLTDRIETRINGEIDRVDLSVGEIMVGIDRRAVPRLWLGEVAVREPDGRDLARLDEIVVGFDPMAALAGLAAPRVLDISGADLVLRRDRDGRFELAPGDGGGLALRSPAALLDGLDAMLSTAPFARAERVELGDVRIRVEDARTAQSWQLRSSAARLGRGPDGLELALAAEIFNGSDDLAGLSLDLSTDAATSAATLSARLDDVPSGDLAMQSPVLSFLEVIAAPLSGALDAEWNADGDLSALSGSLGIGAGALRPRPGTPPLEFHTARAAFSFDAARDRVVFDEISAEGDMGAGAVSGHVTLADLGAGGFPRTLLGQFEIETISVGEGPLFPTPLDIAGGRADLRLRLDPFEVEIGQLILPAAGPDAPPLRANGRVSGAADGWHVGINATVDRLEADMLLAAWPLPVAKGVRQWLTDNLIEGRLSDVSAALRYASGDPKPELSLSFLFDDAAFRALGELPPVTDATGYGSLLGHRLALKLDAGGVVVPDRGRIDLSETTMVVPDTRIKPSPTTFELQTAGPLPALLDLLDRPPFGLLARAGRTPDLASGDVALSTRLTLPLKRGIVPEEVEVEARGEVRDLVSDAIVAGKVLRAERMAIEASRERIGATGEASLAGVPFRGSWEQALAGEDRGQGRVEGMIGVSPEGLAAFGVALPAGLVSGTGEARIDLALAPDEAPRIALRSDLRGIALDIPAVAWSKPAGAPAQFAIEGRLGETPRIDSLSLDAPGLDARGRLRIAPGPRLEALELDRVVLGAWLDAGVTIRPQGAGHPAAITVEDGAIDIRHVRLGEAGAGAGSGGGAARGPIRLRLDRLTVTDTVALSDFALDLPAGRALQGRFSGRVNGGVGVEGALEGQDGGVAIRLATADAGAVLSDAGIIDRVSGGRMDLRLTPTGSRGTYDGELLARDIRLRRAPAMAKLLSAVSVVGLIEQLEGEGIVFNEVAAEFRIAPSQITLYSSSATGASIGLSMDGTYDPQARLMDMQGLVSPFYLVNRVGSVFTRRGEGLFGVGFTLRGPVADPAVGVNPLSILAPGTFREIFRRPPPSR